MSADPAIARIEQLIVLTERLTGLLAAQCQAFEKRRPQDAAAGMEDVSRLANAYRHESAEIRQIPTILSSAPAPLRSRLTRATEAFDAVLARQGRAVAAAKTVTEGLVRAVAEEVAARRANIAGYGPTARAGNTAATSITLNRQA